MKGKTYFKWKTRYFGLKFDFIAIQI